MVYSLYVAREFLTGDVLISYGDIVYSEKILKKLTAFDGDIGVAIDKGWEDYWRKRFQDPLCDAETLKINDGGLIVEIGGKPSSISQIEGQYMGLVKLSSKGANLFSQIIGDAFSSRCHGQRIRKDAYLTDLLMEIIKFGTSVSAICHNDPWVEVDTPEDLISHETLRRLSAIEGAQSGYS